MRSFSFKKEYIPNYLSVFRILLVPIYILCFFGLIGNNWGMRPYFLSGVIFIFAGFTDALDGFLARRNHWITDIGKLLDPLADKLLEVAVTVCLAIEFGGPFVILSAIIITKEIVMIVGAYLMMSKSNVYVSAVWCGKLATIVWYLLICVAHFFSDTTKGNMHLSTLLCIVLILVMLMAFGIYILNYASQIKTTKDAIIRKNHKNH